MDPRSPWCCLPLLACLSLASGVDGPATAPMALVTSIAAGDQRDAELARSRPGLASFDGHQDDGRALLQPVALPALAADAVPPGAVRLVVDRQARFQVMRGYGAAMTDASAALLAQLQRHRPELYEQVMRRCFSPTGGAGFSVLRVPVGSSDFTAAPAYFTHCDRPSADLADFSIDQYRAAVIPQILAARRLNPRLTVIATPWSAPAWMKTNGRLEGISSDEKQRGATNRLKAESFPLYAAYLVRFVREMRAAGVPLEALTLQNEPQFDSAAYPCMRLDEAEQVRLAALVAEGAAGLTPALRIYAHDHNAILHPDDRVVVGGDRKPAPRDSVTAVLSDEVGGKAFNGSAWHWYSGDGRQTAEVYEAIHARFPGHGLLFTEGTGWGFKRGPWFGTIQWGMDTAWMNAPQHWAEMVLMWNLVLDERGGPTLRSDSQGVGLGTVDAVGWSGVRFEREFYAMAHLSRAAQPGAQRVGATLTGSDALSPVVFRQGDGRMAAVLFNRGPALTVHIVDGAGAYRVELPAQGIATCFW